MIIEAGYDIAELMHYSVMHDDKSRRALWVLCLDDHLRYLNLSKACDVMSGTLEEHIDDIEKVLQDSCPPAAYFALGHMATAARLHSDPDDWLYETDERIQLMPALVDYQLLGRVVFDSDGYFSSVPHYSFRDYPSLSELPRTASIPGPHDIGCRCLACDQHEKTLARNRQRYDESRESDEE